MRRIAARELVRHRRMGICANFSGEQPVATEKQKRAARQNIKKAAQAAKKKRTIAHLPKATRTALGKQAAKVRNSH
jgi:hypothetical protein